MRRSTARAGGTGESSQAVQYFQEDRVASVRTGQSESGGGWRRLRIDRGLRARPEQQPAPDLESHVVRDVFSAPVRAVAIPKKTEARGDWTFRRWRTGLLNGGHTVLGAPGGTVLPSRLLWLSA